MQISSAIDMRSAMTQDEFDRRFGFEPPQPPNLLRSAAKSCRSSITRPFSSPSAFWHSLTSFIPILAWLPSYEWKSNLMHDAIAGVTVGIMHVPQGIAYAILAGQDPVVGLYTSLFPVFTYMIFGTSRHCSIGSFAVVALMAGKAIGSVLQEQTDLMMKNETMSHEPYSPIQIASTLTFCIGIVQVLVGGLGLSLVTTYFSDEVVGGFTTGASMHVFVTQIKDILGIYGTPERSGAANMFLKVYDLASRIGQTNITALVFSVCTMTILLLGKYLVNPQFQKRLRSPVPIPFELLVVIAGTLISLFFHMEDKLGLKTVGKIPTGLPLPSAPTFSLFIRLLPDAISIAIVIMAIHVSLAKMFAKKYDYVIDTKQEFFAMGAASLLSGCFPTYPNSCSLARTMVNAEAGTKTQLSGLFSCLFLLVIVQFSGSWLRPLPMCVLASIIIVALTGMFKKFLQLKTLWPVSKIDFLIWLVAFTGTAAIDVLPGLILAVAFALFTTVVRQQWPSWRLLGLVGSEPGQDYRDIERYRCAYFIKNICILRFDSPLLFTNVDRFRAVVAKLAADWDQTTTGCQGRDKITPVTLTKSDLGCDEKKVIEPPSDGRFIVIDCSGFVYVDMMGANALREICTDMEKQGVAIMFAAAKAALRDILQANGSLTSQCFRASFYPTIHDAVVFAQNMSDNISSVNGDDSSVSESDTSSTSCTTLDV